MLSWLQLHYLLQIAQHLDWLEHQRQEQLHIPSWCFPLHFRQAILMPFEHPSFRLVRYLCHKLEFCFKVRIQVRLPKILMLMPKHKLLLGSSWCIFQQKHSCSLQVVQCNLRYLLLFQLYTIHLLQVHYQGLVLIF